MANQSKLAPPSARSRTKSSPTAAAAAKDHSTDGRSHNDKENDHPASPQRRVPAKKHAKDDEEYDESDRDMDVDAGSDDNDEDDYGFANAGLGAASGMISYLDFSFTDCRLQHPTTMTMTTIKKKKKPPVLQEPAVSVRRKRNAVLRRQRRKLAKPPKLTRPPGNSASERWSPSLLRTQCLRLAMCSSPLRRSRPCSSATAGCQ
ncbi:hypothetical protein B0H19DRAFT_1111108 [Mycena capillaripes]|nr:hypothetical protein B0H19DRAFT_1124497 [Mycena capillaripes]KAJ6585984.1 hypothetical protein B0H19DRAFT_1111108 [Mycena capillaripes]